MIIAILLAIATAVAIITTIVTICRLFSYLDIMEQAIQFGYPPNVALIQESQRLTLRFFLLVACTTCLVMLLILLPVITHHYA